MWHQIRLKKPKILEDANKRFLKEVKRRKLKDKLSIFKLHKEKELKLSYNYNEVKKKLSEMCSMRCTFCGRIMHQNEKEKELNRKATIEHIREKSNHPKEIFNWNNLIYCCERCNGARKNKEYETKYLDPSKEKQIATYFIYKANGEIASNEKLSSRIIDSANYMIELYNLNSDSNKRLKLKLMRKDFYFQIINPNFKTLLKLEGLSEKEYVKSEIITFYYMYEYFERNR